MPSDVYCTYPEPTTFFYDILTGEDLSTLFTSDYSTGLVTVSWDGIDLGFFGYTWGIVGEMASGDSQQQDFTVNYLSASSLNCAVAIWQTSTALTQSFTESFGDFNQIILIPDATTDVEITAGSTNFCGEKVYTLSYTSTGGSSWVTLDLVTGFL